MNHKHCNASRESFYIFQIRPCVDPSSKSMQDTATPRVPQELCDTILEHLGADGDLITLRTCAMVSQSWLPSSRRHHLLELRPKSLGTLLEIFESPFCSFSRYTSALELTASGFGDGEDDMPSLTSVSDSDEEGASTHPPAPPNTTQIGPFDSNHWLDLVASHVDDKMPALKSLDIHMPYTILGSTFTNITNALSSITHLRVSPLHFEAFDHFLHHSTIAPTLEHIVADIVRHPQPVTNGTQVLSDGALIDRPLFLSLQSICLTLPVYPETAPVVVWNFLQCVGQSLRALTLLPYKKTSIIEAYRIGMYAFESFTHYLNSSTDPLAYLPSDPSGSGVHYDNLDIIELNCSSALILPILSRIASPTLQTLSIALFYSARHGVEAYQSIWTELGRCISKSSFLEKIKLLWRNVPEDQMELVESKVRSFLNPWDGKDILVFEFTLQSLSVSSMSNIAGGGEWDVGPTINN